MQKHTITLPIFILQSQIDQTIESASTLAFFKNQPNPLNRMLWYSPLNQPLNDRRIQTIPYLFNNARILGLSHLSLILSKHDTMYGLQGAYKDCLFYQAQSAPWKNCKIGENTYWGEVTSDNVKNHTIQRITFNPLYEDMLKALDLFLKNPE